MNRRVHNPKTVKRLPTLLVSNLGWLRGVDLNHRPLGYEPNELPDCSTPQSDHSQWFQSRQLTIVKGKATARQKPIAF